MTMLGKQERAIFSTTMRSRPRRVRSAPVQMTPTAAPRAFPVGWLQRAATQAKALETAIGVWSALASHPADKGFVPEHEISAWLQSGYARRLQLIRLEKAGLLTIRRDPMRAGWHVRPVGMY